MFHLNPLDTAQVPAIFDILLMLELKDSHVALINTDDIYGEKKVRFHNAIAWRSQFD